jgi:BirA family transcriptional regulator, biotin operon repressor / biotin---[acetyl-CoA-carboxylase] ligase
VRYENLDAPALAPRLGIAEVVLLETTPSTLDVAHELGARGAPSGTLVLAEEQTAGRGRYGRRWISPPGAGIWLAMLLRPRASPVGGAIAIRAGLETVAALASVAPGLAPRLKWPNDIMVGGRKTGGILCEARWSGEVLGWVAVGIGINVKGPPPPGLDGAAGALDEVVPGLGRLTVLEALVPRIRALELAEAALTDQERARFLEIAWRAPGETESAHELGPDGALYVRRRDGSLDRRTEPA